MHDNPPYELRDTAFGSSWLRLRTEGEGKRPKWLRQLEGGHSLGKEIDTMADERRMLSRFGVWMMAALCPPNANADQVKLLF
ncbi:hypothetical protein TELCIR_15387 [Teladorsagia circumcincta]|uniref:Uncharacterized protein n=1 Tax=Teladorsagia circumcincta TaxID=45464 RepID=A0A2G9U009_TELCI|nr:hypothetical protein TELCIR_15387 [Teladorsagia circumcincta]